jgi:hypothetical protein
VFTALTLGASPAVKGASLDKLLAEWREDPDPPARVAGALQRARGVKLASVATLVALLLLVGDLIVSEGVTAFL